ncbi:MAG TPA: triple tyrosine motif-containing protein, partial [Verrucomicrobiae bacterium]|nr:triple tyrosine motif-containing protein [Verrucomicrobiae bacterium]
MVRYSEAAGLRHPFVSALWVDSRGTLWAGTLGGGLSGWNGSRFVTLTTREGLAHNSVEQLLEDDRGYLWLGTRIGLMRISLDQLHEFLASDRAAITGTVLGEEEGISGPNLWTEYQPASLRSNDGKLWFCTGRGVVAIDPDQFAAKTTPPLVHIEAVAVDGETTGMEADNEVPVPPDHDRLEIGFTGIAWSRPDQVRFRYRLDGYDREWVEAGRSRFASYSHLPPGRYRFEVAAVNNDGIWSDAEATVALVVQRAYWQTPWFRGLMFAFVLGVATALYRRRVRGLERQREVQEAFSRRLIESQENERKRIAAELHDSLGQNLLVVRNLALMAVENRSVDSPAVREFREISDTAGQALDEVRSISHALR